MLKDGTTEMYFKHGPVFAYVVLVDEINRTTPKVQSGLLEAMAEKQVTIDGNRYLLGSLFFCIATQNPLDKVGTFDLPAAQLDRFLFKRRLRPIESDAVKRVMTMDLHTEGESSSEKLPEKVKLTEVVAVRDYLLKTVELAGVKEESAHNMTDFLIEIQEKFKELEASNKMHPGSVPSPRTLKRLVKVMQIQAFVSAAKKIPDPDQEGKFKVQIDMEEAQVLPRHLKGIATDVLRHRIFPVGLSGGNYQEKEENLDEMIDALVKEALANHEDKKKTS